MPPRLTDIKPDKPEELPPLVREPDLESEPRLCPIIEYAMAEASLECASPEQRASMVAYVERCKSDAAWEIIMICAGLVIGPELVGLAMVRLHTGVPMPDAWESVDSELRDALTRAILGKSK